MLVVRMFLLAVEEHFRNKNRAGTGNRVACDNKAALFTFQKKSKRIPASSSNADVRRALREVQRRSANHYQLRHVKGHQDRTKKRKHMTLEERLNVECDALAKGAVTDSVRPGMGPSRQALPLERARST